MEADVAELKVCKSGTSFILSDKDDRLPADCGSPCGIYRDDMRLVRAFEISDGESSPSGALRQKRAFFYEGNLYQELVFSSPEEKAVNLNIRFLPGCDDIFDIRDERVCALPYEEKPFRGSIVSQRYGDSGASLSVKGAYSGRNYKTGFSSSEKGLWEEKDFKIAFSLNANEEKILYLIAGDETSRLPGLVQEQFAGASEGVRHDRERLRQYGPHLRAQDNLVNKAIEQAQEELSVMITDLETGPYPYAGLPWFSCPFGRDAAITALLLLDYYPDVARGVLAFQAKHQATNTEPQRQSEPGKIFHEMRFGEASLGGENPFSAYYGGVDTTALFVMLAGAYLERTGNLDFLYTVQDNIDHALAWLIDNMTAYNGFVRYQYDPGGLIQQCWKDSSDSMFSMENPEALAQDPIATCEVQAYVYEALLTGKKLAALAGDAEKAEYYDNLAQQLYQDFNEKFWMSDPGCYAMALDGNDRQLAVISSNAGHCLLSGIVPQERAVKMAERLMQEDSFSGYGIRTLAKGYRFDPLSYHRGSIWPHDTALVAMGMRRHGLKKFSNDIFDGLMKMYEHTGKIPELFAGDSIGENDNEKPRDYPSACLIQSWAAAAYLSFVAGRDDIIMEPHDPQTADPALRP